MSAGEIYDLEAEITVTNYTDSAGEVFIIYVLQDNSNVVIDSSRNWSKVMMAGQTATFEESFPLQADRDVLLTGFDSEERVVIPCRVTRASIYPQ